MWELIAKGVLEMKTMRKKISAMEKMISVSHKYRFHDEQPLDVILD